jgi:hypothetical protein
LRGEIATKCARIAAGELRRRLRNVGSLCNVWRMGEIVTRGTGRVSEETLIMPRPRDPEGLARRYLIEDRRERL